MSEVKSNTTNSSVAYHKAIRTDLEEVQSLLKKNKLPFEDLASSNIEIIVAVENGQIIGCIGNEIKGEDGLLRSFSVADEFKNLGIGNELFKRLILEAQKANLKTLHLLTTTASSYFNKKGFVVSNRNEAPENIKSTSEFSTICPSNSVYMTFKVSKQNYS